MLRKTHLVLSYGSGPVFDAPEFWAYVKSAKNVADADFVILSDDPSDVIHKVNSILLAQDSEVCVIKTDKLTNMFRDRHLSYWKYLNDHGHKYKYI